MSMDTLLFHNIIDEHKDAVRQFLSAYRPVKNEHAEYLKQLKAVGKKLNNSESQQAFDRILQLFRLIHRKERLIQKTILNLYIPLLDEDPNKADLCRLLIEDDIEKLNKMVNDVENLVYAFNAMPGNNYQSRFFAPFQQKAYPNSFSDSIPTVRPSGLARKL